MSDGGKPVLDAAAILALIQDEPGAKRLLELLPKAVAGAVNVAEVLAKLVGKGMPPREALVAFDALHLEVVGFDSAEAVISASYVKKGVSLGDRCFLATAHTHGTGWTSDRILALIGHERRPRLEFFR